MQQCAAEAIGTALLVAFGTGSVAQYLLKDQSDSLPMHVTWGLGVTFGIIASYRVSGGHLNPAVSIGFWSVGSFPTEKIPPYILAQTLGAFFGAAYTFFQYYDVLQADRSLETSGIFCTYPSEGVSWCGAFVIEALATAVLQFGIMTIVDEHRGEKGIKWLYAGFAGLLVFAIGIAFGANTGYAINPARDLGPRLFTLFTGWGKEPWTAKNAYFVVPIVAPILGGMAGAHLAKRTVLS